MGDLPMHDRQYVTPAEVADVLHITVDEVIALAMTRRLRGARVGVPARWRIEAASVTEYLDDQAEDARRSALWQQSQEASFPELWGTGTIRNPD